MTDKDKRIRTKIIKYISQGLRPPQAAILAGISERTYYRWKEDDDSFVRSIEASEYKLEAKLADSLAKTGIQNKNPQALMGMLERRFNERWSPKVLNEISGPNGDSVVFKVDVSGGYIPPENVLGIPSTLTTKKPATH